MERNETGMSWIWVLFIVVIIYLIFDKKGINSGNGYEGGCGRVSNCEVEKREIIDSARNQFLIGQEGGATREALHNTQDALMAQANRIYEQGLQEKIFDLKMENTSLKAEASASARFNALSTQLANCCCDFNRRFDVLDCQVVKRPQFYPYGFNSPNCNPGCNPGCCNA